MRSCGRSEAIDASTRHPSRIGAGGARRHARTLVLACAAVSLLVVSACSSSGGSGTQNGKQVVTFANWADAEQNTQPGIEAMIKEFEKENPNITVKSLPISYTDIEHQLVLQVQSGNTPDVAELQGNYTFSLQATGALQSLDSYANGSYQQSVIPQELQLGNIDGQLVAIPWTVAPFALWYNKKVMAQAGLDPKPPATWDELLTDLAAIHQKAPKIIAFGTDSTNRTYGLDQNWPVMKSFGGVPFDGKDPSADTQAMKDYLNFMRTVASKGYTPPNKKGGFFRQPAASDQVAFTIDGPYVKGVVQSTSHVSDAQFYQTWGIAPLPSGSDGKHYSAPTDHQLVMFSKAKNKDAAWKFMQFLSTSDYAIQNYTLKYENSLPPLQTPTGEIAKELDNPISQAFKTDVIPTVIRPNWGTAYDNAYSDVMTGVQSAMTSSSSIDSIASHISSALKNDLGG
jgi:multiple sugar transport system substrate-binding protein